MLAVVGLLLPTRNIDTSLQKQDDVSDDFDDDDLVILGGRRSIDVGTTASGITDTAPTNISASTGTGEWRSRNV